MRVTGVDVSRGVDIDAANVSKLVVVVGEDVVVVPETLFAVNMIKKVTRK